MRVPLLYRDEPMFGFDIGNRSIKIVQLHPTSGHHCDVLGYGYAEFSADTIIEGIIVDPEPIVKVIKPILNHMPNGKVTAKRVALSLPVAKVFTRVLQLPPMTEADLAQAIKFEAEQYIPVPLPDLYIDYNVFDQVNPIKPVQPKADSEDQADQPATTSVLMVAAPRAIVDSYVKLMDQLGLEVGLVESSLSAAARALTSTTPLKGATMITDIGGQSTDVTVVDQVLRLTNTIAIGGDDFTTGLVSSLNISPEEATEIKFKFGLGPSGLQGQILPALEPKLKKLTEELRRVIRFYGERTKTDHPIDNIVLTGGTAGMPGLADYLKAQLSLNIVIGNAWNGLQTKHVHPVTKLEAPLYTTAIGLALAGARQ